MKTIFSSRLVLSRAQASTSSRLALLLKSAFCSTASLTTGLTQASISFFCLLSLLIVVGLPSKLLWKSVTPCFVARVRWWVTPEVSDQALFCNCQPGTPSPSLSVGDQRVGVLSFSGLLVTSEWTLIKIVDTHQQQDLG